MCSPRLSGEAALQWSDDAVKESTLHLFAVVSVNFYIFWSMECD